jgi:hypothetical protein
METKLAKYDAMDKIMGKKETINNTIKNKEMMSNKETTNGKVPQIKLGIIKLIICNYQSESKKECRQESVKNSNSATSVV